MGQAQDIAEEILWDTRDQKKEEDDEDPFVFQDVVVFAKGLRLDDPLHQGQPEDVGEQKGKPGPDGEPDRRIEVPRMGP